MSMGSATAMGPGLGLGQGPVAGSVASALRISQACEYAKKFTEIFYEKVDKGRHTIGSLYHEAASLVWNGHRVQGKAQILAFYEKLATSETQLMSLDAQPVLEVAGFEGQTVMTISCSGRVRFGSKFRLFTECFTLVAENEVWKIVADTYRNY